MAHSFKILPRDAIQVPVGGRVPHDVLYPGLWQADARTAVKGLGVWRFRGVGFRV